MLCYSRHTEFLRLSFSALFQVLWTQVYPVDTNYCIIYSVYTTHIMYILHYSIQTVSAISVCFENKQSEIFWAHFKCKNFTFWQLLDFGESWKKEIILQKHSLVAVFIYMIYGVFLIGQKWSTVDANFWHVEHHELLSTIYC